MHYITRGASGGGGISGVGGSSGSLSSGGDSCPPEGTEVLPNDEGFSLFFVQGETVIYACQNGVVIGRCVFRSGPAPPPTGVRSIIGTSELTYDLSFSLTPSCAVL